jgi:hypothetical protein
MAVLAFETPSETPQSGRQASPEPCPASAAAEAVVRIEIAFEAASWKLMQTGLPQVVMHDLEDECVDLLMAAEAARDRLAAAIPTSHAGATAQLLAAIHDLRVRDDAEIRRARQLEARALTYLKQAHDKQDCVLDVKAGRRLSQTRQSDRSRSVVGLERAPI